MVEPVVKVLALIRVILTGPRTSGHLRDGAGDGGSGGDCHCCCHATEGGWRQDAKAFEVILEAN